MGVPGGGSGVPAGPPEARAGDPLIGRIIGSNFRVLKLIGTGAMGHVYQAEQMSLGKMVALKLLRNELMVDERLIKRFELEARNASRLNHPNSIQIIDFGRDEGLLYIAMELLQGVDLGQLILREGPLSLARIGRIMDQVLGALDEAHAQGIVHRDLKPSNIMLASRRGDPDFVKVCDFGIAKAQTSREGAGLTMKGLVCGTPEYMSPEQARGDEVDGRSDLYALGVILYQLVTGELPFTASSPVGILSKHLSDLPQPPSLRKPGLQLPGGLERVILTALNKEAADRHQSAEELRRDLRTTLAGVPAMLDRSPIPVPVSSWTALDRGAMPGQPTTPVTIPHPGASGAARPGSSAVPSVVLSPPSSTQLTRRTGPLFGLALGLAGLATAAWFLLRPAAGPDTAALTRAATTTVVPLPERPSPPPPAPPPAVEEAPAPLAVEAERPRRVKRTRRSAGAVVAAPAAPDRSPEEPAPPADGMNQAEQLLAQGEVVSACEKGEDHKRMNPQLPRVFRFLGKCYMRAGQPDRARENYRRYLELAPDAPDAAFIKSIVK
jgi:serine/threonine protein kinase